MPLRTAGTRFLPPANGLGSFAMLPFASLSDEAGCASEVESVSRCLYSVWGVGEGGIWICGCLGRTEFSRCFGGLRFDAVESPAPETRCFINGSFASPTGSKTWGIVDPCTEEAFCTVTEARYSPKSHRILSLAFVLVRKAQPPRLPAATAAKEP